MKENLLVVQVYFSTLNVREITEVPVYETVSILAKIVCTYLPWLLSIVVLGKFHIISWRSIVALLGHFSRHDFRSNRISMRPYSQRYQSNGWISKVNFVSINSGFIQLQLQKINVSREVLSNTFGHVAVVYTLHLSSN